MTRAFIAITLVALAAALAACDGDDDASPTPPATTATATTTPVSGVLALTVGEPVAIPEDLALIITTGCWQCDGPTNAIVRIRRTLDRVEERTLFDAVPAGGGITGFAFDVPTGRAAVSTCGPNCTGLGETTGAEESVLHTSIDGGASFREWGGDLDGWYSVEGYAHGDLLIIGPFGAPDGPELIRIFRQFREAPRPPGGHDPHPMPSEVLWTTDARTALLATDGTVLFTSTGDEILSVTPLDTAGERLAMLIFRRDPEQLTTGYRLFIGDRDGNILDQEITVGPAFLSVGAALDECTIVGNADIPAGAIPTPDTGGAFFSGFLPALIDICDGVIHPIVDPFTREPYLNGRNLIAAVQVGPFLAVAHDVGDCLNVRESASVDAVSLGCFAAGVLLRDLEEPQDVDGQTWRRVATPAGDEGWASGEFLTP